MSAVIAWVALVQAIREAIPVVKTVMSTMVLPPAESLTGLFAWVGVLAVVYLWVWLSGDARMKLTATLYGRWRQAAGLPMIDLDQSDPVSFYSSLKNAVRVHWSGWAKPASVRLRGTAGVVTVGLQVRFLRDLQALTGGKEKYVCSFDGVSHGWLEAKAVGWFTGKIESKMMKRLTGLELMATVRPAVYDESTVTPVAESESPVESMTWEGVPGGMLSPVEKDMLAATLSDARGGEWLVSSTVNGDVTAARKQTGDKPVMDVDGDGGFTMSDATPDWVRAQQAQMRARQADGTAGRAPYSQQYGAGYAGSGDYAHSSRSDGPSESTDPAGNDARRFYGGKPAGMNYVNQR